MLKNERGAAAIEMIFVALLFVGIVTLVTPVFKDLMGQNGESGIVDNVITKKAGDVQTKDITVTDCAVKESCKLED